MTYNIFYHGKNRWEVWNLDSATPRPRLLTRLRVLVPCDFKTKRGAGGWAQAKGRLKCRDTSGTIVATVPIKGR